MKKFVGNVNGKSFDNEEDFNKAADEAIKSNDGNLSISSYYSYTKDDEDEDKEKKADDHFVSTYEYFLGDRKPDTVDTDGVVYNVSEKLKARLEEASNKENIKESVNYHVEKLVNTIHSEEKKENELQKEIENLQNKLYEYESELKDLKGRRKYYNTILDILDKATIAIRDKETENESKKGVLSEDYQVTPEVKDKVRALLNIDSNTSLFSILRQLGILK